VIPLARQGIVRGRLAPGTGAATDLVVEHGRKGRFTRARLSRADDEISPGHAGGEEHPAENDESRQEPAGGKRTNTGDSSRAQLALKLPQARNHSAHLAAKGDQIDFHNFSTLIQFVE